MIRVAPIGSTRETVRLRLWGKSGWTAGSLPVRQQLMSCPLLRAPWLPGTVTGTVLGRVRSRNRSEPLESRAAVVETTFTEAVDARVRANRGKGGWQQGSRRLLEEMVEETLDIPGWARGLDLHEIPDRVEARVERAIEHASEAYTELQLALRDLDRG